MSRIVSKTLDGLHWSSFTGRLLSLCVGLLSWSRCALLLLVLPLPRLVDEITQYCMGVSDDLTLLGRTHRRTKTSYLLLSSLTWPLPSQWRSPTLVEIALIEVLEHIMESVIQIARISHTHLISLELKLLSPLVGWRVLRCANTSSFKVTRKNSWALSTGFSWLSPSSLGSNHVLVVFDWASLLDWSCLSSLSFDLHLLLTSRQVQETIEAWNSWGRCVNGLVLICWTSMRETLMKSFLRMWIYGLASNLVIRELVIEETCVLFRSVKWWSLPTHCCRKCMILPMSRFDCRVSCPIWRSRVGLLVEIEHVSVWACYSLSIGRLLKLLDLLGLVEITHFMLRNPLIHHWLGHLFLFFDCYSLHILLWLMGINNSRFQISLLLLPSTFILFGFKIENINGLLPVNLIVKDELSNIVPHVWNFA